MKKALRSSGFISTHARNDSVTIARGDEVLDLAGRSLGELAAADEMRGEVEFGGVAAGSAIGVPIELGGSSAHCVGHLCSNGGHERGVQELAGRGEKKAEVTARRRSGAAGGRRG